jgi:hypothetical protein
MVVPAPPSGGVDFGIDNPTPHRLPEGENATPLEVIGTTASDKLVIVMVGLPATGTNTFHLFRSTFSLYCTF